MIPKATLMWGGNELVAVLPHYLPIYPAIFSTAIVTLTLYEGREHTTTYLNSSRHLKSFFFDGAEGCAHWLAHHQGLSAEVSSPDWGSLRGPSPKPGESTWVSPSCSISPCKFRPIPVLLGTTIFHNTGQDQALSSRHASCSRSVLSLSDSEQNSCLPKASSAAAREGLRLILETIRLVKTQRAPPALSQTASLLLLRPTSGTVTTIAGSLHPKT